jgi:pyrroline-5-carboxylate reductase
MRIGFIGLGNMATAMIGGMVRQGVVSAGDIVGSSKSLSSAEKAVKNFGISGACDNVKVAQEADILFLAVKPQMYAEVIEQIREHVQESALIVSIAPGKTMEWLTQYFQKEVKLVRCMPNTPALVGEGCTGVCHNELVSEEEFELVMKLLNSFGKAIEVKEHLMDAVVGVSGSSPAYVFVMIEAMADAAVADGMPRKQAYEFAAQAVYGSAKMVLETGKHPAELKDMVCSPAGTTIEAVRVLEEKGFRSALIEAQKACVAKSKGL